jgi:predicted aspartyl protease
MLSGFVNEDDQPIIMLPVAGQDWPALVDSGFNGDLELPESLRPAVNARFHANIDSNLAGGQQITEATYLVEFPFDGRTVTAEATFTQNGEIIIGTHLLPDYCLEIDFPNGTVQLTRTRGG